jgi:hypothetical protein
MYRLVAAGVAALERGVDRVREKPGVLEIGEVAGEHRAHELALAEDAGVSAVRRDDGQRGQVAVDQRADRAPELLVGADRGRLLDDQLADRARAHAYLTIT